MRGIFRIATAMAYALFARDALAQSWPSKPIRLVVPFAAGGAVDGVARIFAAKFQDSLKVPVVVENRAGAGGNIGVDSVAKSPPDGYTILLNTNGQAVSPAIYKSLPWDPFRDFTPITQLMSTNMIFVVSPKVPAKTLQEFFALAKARPGALNYASSGIGNALHLTFELLKLRTGTDIQMVPYRGDAEILNALIAGDVEASLMPISTGKAQVESGAIRALAVTTPQRAKGLEWIPTVAEQGLPGFSAGGWQALFAPAKTPVEIVERIYQESLKALQAPDVLQRLEGFAVIPVGSSPAEFAAAYRDEVENFKKIVREAKIPLQE